jgi:hypothetical protein
MGGDGPHEVAVAWRETLEHRHGADVHRVAFILNRDEHRILRAHAIQWRSLRLGVEIDAP